MIHDLLNLERTWRTGYEVVLSDQERTYFGHESSHSGGPHLAARNPLAKDLEHRLLVRLDDPAVNRLDDCTSVRRPVTLALPPR